MEYYRTKNCFLSLYKPFWIGFKFSLIVQTNQFSDDEFFFLHYKYSWNIMTVVEYVKSTIIVFIFVA